MIKKLGYEPWSKKFEYGKRWSSEIVFSKLKRLFGETVRSKKEENIRQEFTIKIWIYNMLVAIQHRYKEVLFFVRFFWLVLERIFTRNSKRFGNFFYSPV